MLNIVIPMAGLGSRFVKANYKVIKPMIPILGFPMIQVVVHNLTPSRPHRFIFICQNKHIEEYSLKQKLSSYAPNCEIIGTEGLTEGQLCSVLLARDLINDDSPVMMANSDQYIDIEIDDYLNDIDEKKLDGMIMTMYANDPKWSYAKLDNNGYVVETAEKKVISNRATVGVYNFSKGKEFIKYADQLIKDNIRINNEFYTCPVYNYAIKGGLKIGTYNIGEEANGLYGLGIPKDLELFIEHPVSKKIMST